MNGARPGSIAASTTIDELIRRYPATADVFIRRRMHCVGCEVDRFHTLADACRAYGLRVESFVAELACVAGVCSGATSDAGD